MINLKNMKFFKDIFTDDNYDFDFVCAGVFLLILGFISIAIYDVYMSYMTYQLLIAQKIAATPPTFNAQGYGIGGSSIVASYIANKKLNKVTASVTGESTSS